MVGELLPVPVDPAHADRDFWSRYHVLRRMRQAEMFPDDPLDPDGVVEARMKKGNAFDQKYYFEVSRSGEMLGWMSGERATPKNPEYATNKQYFWADVYVRRQDRRQRVATRLVGAATRLMDELGATVMGTTATNEPAHGFLKWLGGVLKLSEIESRLKLSDVDWAMMRRWVDEGARRSPQTRLEIFDGRLPESMWEKFAEQRTILLNTMPFEDLEIGDIIVTRERMRHEYERMALTGDVVHDVVTWEADGSISAMTDVQWAPYRRSLIYQEFTGVRPDARGRGLGKWIKAAMVLHLRELYPDAEWIATGNAHSNGPMLNINRAMGFQPYRTMADYQVTRQELEKTL